MAYPKSMSKEAVAICKGVSERQRLGPGRPHGTVPSPGTREAEPHLSPHSPAPGPGWDLLPPSGKGLSFAQKHPRGPFLTLWRCGLGPASGPTETWAGRDEAGGPEALPESWDPQQMRRSRGSLVALHGTVNAKACVRLLFEENISQYCF